MDSMVTIVAMDTVVASSNRDNRNNSSNRNHRNYSNNSISKIYNMSYKKLNIWQLSRSLVIDIHKMSLALPAFEKYEEGSQIRRSSKSVKSNIVEGYGRK